MEPWFTIEMHCHTSHGSADAKQDIPDIVWAASQNGFDAVCLTDHHSYAGWVEAAAYQNTTPLKLFMGIELRAIEGDILVYSREMIKWPGYGKAHAQKLIDIANENGAFVVIPHPFRQNGPVSPNAVGPILDELTGFHGIEIQNNRNNYMENYDAVAWYLERREQKPFEKIYGFTGGDCHTGLEFAEFPVRSIQSFRGTCPETQDEFIDFLFDWIGQ